MSYDRSNVSEITDFFLRWKFQRSSISHDRRRIRIWWRFYISAWSAIWIHNTLASFAFSPICFLFFFYFQNKKKIVSIDELSKILAFGRFRVRILLLIFSIFHLSIANLLIAFTVLIDEEILYWTFKWETFYFVHYLQFVYYESFSIF